MLPIFVTDSCTIRGAEKWPDMLISSQLSGPANRPHLQGKSTIAPDMLTSDQRVGQRATKKINQLPCATADR
jgi:hypothetical protein